MNGITTHSRYLNRQLAAIIGGACLILMLNGCGSMSYRTGPSMSLKNQPTKANETSNAGGPTIVNDSPGRQMVYSAWLTLVVQRVDTTLTAIKTLTKEAGGYIRLLEGHTITLKVPATKLDAFLAQAESLGVVSNRKLYAEDVTEAVNDIDIRLKNAIEMHKRLLALIDKGGKVEELLKIEKEIQRLTEDIEIIKGKKELFANQIAYASVQITLNASIPQNIIDEEIPFDWVKQLADDMLTGKIKDSWSRTGGEHVAFTLPTDFVSYHESGYVTRATSADGVLLKVQRHQNFKGGSLKFWSTLIRKSLVKKCAITLKPDEALVIHGKKPAILIQGTREISGKSMDYLLVLTMNKKHVYTFEAWGEPNAVSSNMDNLKASAKTLRTGSWFFGL